MEKEVDVLEMLILDLVGEYEGDGAELYRSKPLLYSKDQKLLGLAIATITVGSVALSAEDSGNLFGPLERGRRQQIHRPPGSGRWV